MQYWIIKCNIDYIYVNLRQSEYSLLLDMVIIFLLRREGHLSKICRNSAVSRSSNSVVTLRSTYENQCRPSCD